MGRNLVARQIPLVRNKQIFLYTYIHARPLQFGINIFFGRSDGNVIEANKFRHNIIMLLRIEHYTRVCRLIDNRFVIRSSIRRRRIRKVLLLLRRITPLRPINRNNDVVVVQQL